MSAATQHHAQRRAALAVHAMAPADRDWVLRELPVDQRTQLLPLLDELGELGIPQDARLLRDATAGTPSLPATIADQDPAHRLSASSARALAHWLHGEPPQVTARLIQACPAWRAPLVAALPRARQRAIVSLAADLPRAPELERLVLAAARRRLLPNEATSPWAWLRKVAAPFILVGRH